jgi:hypothetical protein
MSHVMRIMDQVEGDISVSWDPKSAASIQEARSIFDQRRSQGMVAYKVDPVSRASTLLRDQEMPMDRQYS